MRTRAADGTTEELPARAVISAVGSLNRPKLPDLAGMDDFAGPSFHSIRWDHDVDITGRKVALPAPRPVQPLRPDRLRPAQTLLPAPNYLQRVPNFPVRSRTRRWQR